MKRTLSVLAVVVTAATMVFLGVASAQDRESTTQDNTTENVTTQRVVTRTFTNPQAIAVGAAGGANVAVPYPSAISVSGFPRRSRITDVNLTLNNFTFTNSTADVAVMLAKGQRNQGVMADVGAGFGVNNITFTIDDEAANPSSTTKSCQVPSGPALSKTERALGAGEGQSPPYRAGL